MVTASTHNLNNKANNAAHSRQCAKEWPEDKVGAQVQSSSNDCYASEGRAEGLDSQGLGQARDQDLLRNVAVLRVVVAAARVTMKGIEVSKGSRTLCSPASSARCANSQAITLASLSIILHPETAIKLIRAQRPQSNLDLLPQVTKRESEEIDGA